MNWFWGILYLAGWVLTYSATLAYYQREFPTIAKKEFEVDLGLAVMFATVPYFWLPVLFVTRGYRLGFQFWRSP